MKQLIGYKNNLHLSPLFSYKNKSSFTSLTAERYIGVSDATGKIVLFDWKGQIVQFLHISTKVNDIEECCFEILALDRRGRIFHFEENFSITFERIQQLPYLPVNKMTVNYERYYLSGEGVWALSREGEEIWKIDIAESWSKPLLWGGPEEVLVIADNISHKILMIRTEDGKIIDTIKTEAQPVAVDAINDKLFIATTTEILIYRVFDDKLRLEKKVKIDGVPVDMAEEGGIIIVAQRQPSKLIVLDYHGEIIDVVKMIPRTIEFYKNIYLNKIAASSDKIAIAYTNGVLEVYEYEL